MLQRSRQRSRSSSASNLGVQALSAIRRNGGMLLNVPDNFAGVFEESTGITPVDALGDVIGLITDRSYGAGNLGAELVTNGDFSNGAAGWTLIPGVSVSGGALVFDGTTSFINGAALAQATSTSPIVAGKSYLFTYTITGNPGGGISANVGSALGTIRSAAGTYSEILVATSAGIPYIMTRASAGVRTGGVDNISVREVLGNHATQATASQKPVVGRVPNRTRGPVNLLLWSGDFTNAAWTAGKSAGATVGALTTGPDGLQSARLVTFASSSDYLYQGLTAYPAVTGASVTSAAVVNSATRAISYGGASPSGTDVFAAYDMGGGWWLQTLARTFTTTTSALTVQVLPGAVAGTFAYHRAALFTGTVTAQQIIDNGGIQLTTTQPLPNVLSWTNAISFDGTNDFLQTGITTGNEGWVAVGVKHNAATTCYPAAAGGLIDTLAGINLRLINGVTPQVLACDGTLRQVLQADANITQGDAFVNSCGWDGTTLLLGVNNTEKTAPRTRNPTASVGMTIGAADATGAGVVNGTITAVVRCPVLPSAADRALIRRWIGSLQGQTL